MGAIAFSISILTRSHYLNANDASKDPLYLILILRNPADRPIKTGFLFLFFFFFFTINSGFGFGGIDAFFFGGRRDVGRGKKKSRVRLLVHLSSHREFGSCDGDRAC